MQRRTMLSIVSNVKGIRNVLSRQFFAFETADLSEILVEGGSPLPTDRKEIPRILCAPVQRDITAL